MITVTRKDTDTWVIARDALVEEMTAEDLRQQRVVLRNALRLPIPPAPVPDPETPPPVVVEVPVPTNPPPTEALTIAVNAMGLSNVLSTLFAGKTPQQIQALVVAFLPASPAGGKP